MKLAALLSLSLSLSLSLTLVGCSLYEGADQTSAPSADLADNRGLGSDLEQCGPTEVHAFGVYESHGNHSGNNHPPGEASVSIERPGAHALVLSSYEPVNWHVALAEGVKIESVTLLGYHDQQVDLADVPVMRGQACGYSFPYNGQGCDTNELFALTKELVGAPPTTFHGCYQASSWTLHADGTADSNCNTAAGYEVDAYQADCKGDGGGDGKWDKSEFKTYSPATCTGERFVRFDDTYGVYVGAILCGDSRHYKLYMSDRLDAPFLEVADFAGHGQDHCELVNPDFALPDEDDITSGGCADCFVDNVIDIDGVPVYARAKFGEPFARVTARFWADLTNARYACGVAIE